MNFKEVIKKIFQMVNPPFTKYFLSLTGLIGDSKKHETAYMVEIKDPILAIKFTIPIDILRNFY